MTPVSTRHVEWSGSDSSWQAGYYGMTWVDVNDTGPAAFEVAMDACQERWTFPLSMVYSWERTDQAELDEHMAELQRNGEEVEVQVDNVASTTSP